MKKNQGTSYTDAELKAFVNSYTSGQISDEIMIGFLKSIFDHGMTIEKIATLTRIMINSGEIVDLSVIKGIKVDKHSTGGVGDKVTLIIAPILATMGLFVAKMSGRGLGFTGGTIDKLESIPGYNVSLSKTDFIKNVNDHGVAVIAQTETLVPADKKIYDLRNRTNLFASTPLIASSIMAKKIATGADVILLDVKYGDASFMKTKFAAKKIAKIMVDIGNHLHKNVSAQITSMESPLGRAIGNKIEVIEAIEALKGNWTDDLRQVCYSAVVTLLIQGKIFKHAQEAVEAIDQIIAKGLALAKFKEWIESQNGDFHAITRQDFWKPNHNYEIKVDKSGFLLITSASIFGEVARNLGAGRKTKDAKIDFDAGIYLNKKSGDKIKKGETIFTLYSSKKILQEDINQINQAFKIVSQKPQKKVIGEKVYKE